MMPLLTGRGTANHNDLFLPRPFCVCENGYYRIREATGYNTHGIKTEGFSRIHRVSCIHPFRISIGEEDDRMAGGTKCVAGEFGRESRKLSGLQNLHKGSA